MYTLLLPLLLTSAPLEWKLVTGGGVPDHILFVLEGNSPPPRRVLETWRLTTDDPDTEGRSRAHLTTRRGTTDFVLWPEGGKWLFLPANHPSAVPEAAVTRSAPPRVLSTERVPCTSALLGGYQGICAGKPGGPLNAPIFPLSLLVQPGDGGNPIQSLLVIVFTAGTVIPGSRDTSITATLTATKSPPLSPELASLKNAAKKPATLPASLEPELAGATLVLAGAATPELVTALASRLSASDRWVILRLARQRGLEAPGLLVTVSRLAADDALTAHDAPLVASALDGLHPLVSDGIRELVAGRALTLRSQSLRLGSKSFEAEVMKLIEGPTLQPAEAGALAMMLPLIARWRLLSRLLEALPFDDATRLAQSELSQMPPERGVAVLKKAPRWIDRMLKAGKGEQAMAVVPFDDARRELLDPALDRAPAEERRALLISLLSALRFDSSREQFLTRWKSVLPGLEGSEARAILAAFGRGESHARVFNQLLTLVAPGERGELLSAGMGALRFDDERLAYLKAAPAEVLDPARARALLDLFTFDEQRGAAACYLLSVLPPNDRPAFYERALTSQTFDDGKRRVRACRPEGVNP